MLIIRVQRFVDCIMKPYNCMYSYHSQKEISIERLGVKNTRLSECLTRPVWVGVQETDNGRPSLPYPSYKEFWIFWRILTPTKQLCDYLPEKRDINLRSQMNDWCDLFNGQRSQREKLGQAAAKEHGDAQHQRPAPRAGTQQQHSKSEGPGMPESYVIDIDIDIDRS